MEWYGVNIHAFSVQDSSESLGISIAGGSKGQRGDTPVYVTNINQSGCIGRCRQVKVSEKPSSACLLVLQE